MTQKCHLTIMVTSWPHQCQPPESLTQAAFFTHRSKDTWPIFFYYFYIYGDKVSHPRQLIGFSFYINQLDNDTKTSSACHADVISPLCHGLVGVLFGPKPTASIPENLHLFVKTIFQDPLPILEDRLFFSKIPDRSWKIVFCESFASTMLTSKSPLITSNHRQAPINGGFND